MKADSTNKFGLTRVDRRGRTSPFFFFVPSPNWLLRLEKNKCIEPLVIGDKC